MRKKVHFLEQGDVAMAKQRRSAMKAFLGGKGILKALEIAEENDIEDFFDAHPEYDKAKYMRGYKQRFGEDSKGKTISRLILCSFIISFILLFDSAAEKDNTILQGLACISIVATVIGAFADLARRDGLFFKKDADRLYYEKVEVEKSKWLATRPVFNEDSIQQLKMAGKIWLVVFAAYTGIGLIPAVMMLFGKSVSPLSIVAAVLSLHSLDALSETAEITSSTADVANTSDVVESALMMIKIDDLYVDSATGDIYDANHGHVGHVKRMEDTLFVYDDKAGLVSVRDANGVIMDGEGNKLGSVNNDGAETIIEGVDGKRMIITKEGSDSYKVSVHDEFGRTL